MKEALEAKQAALSWLKPVDRELKKWFRSNIKVESKADQSPVTIADRRVEEMLRSRITREFPQHSIIGEEFGTETRTGDWAWTVDPIDGTRSFILGLPLFSTLLSLLHKGKPVMGIIHLPGLGETAWAVQGQGCWMGNQKLQVSSRTSISESTIATGDVYCFRAKRHLKFLNRIQKEAGLSRTYPDAFGHLLAIQGRVDAMVDPWAFIWDFAPCKILVEEAGGLFSNFTGTRGDIQEGTAICGNPKLVRKIKGMIGGSKRKE